MDKPELLMAGRYAPLEVSGMEDAYRLHWLSAAVDRSAFLADVGPRIRAIVTRGDLGADAALMRTMPNLEIVASFGVGYDSIDLAYARQQRIRVTNTPDVLTDDVADMAIALLLATTRRIPTGDRHVRGGAWRTGPMPLTTRMSGKRLGIVGLGRVGRAVAQRALGFNLTVSYASPGRKEVAWPWYPDAAALAAHVDFLVVCAAGGDATRGLIDAKVLAALGPTGILINVARGSIVDETALLAALRAQQIGGAGLDVFWNEPAIDPRFAEFETVVLQPHNGSGTVETRTAIGVLVRENLAAHFAGRPLPTPVI